MIDGGALPISRRSKGSIAAVFSNALTGAFARLGYAGLPGGLVRYLVVVTAAGLATPWLAALLNWQAPSGRELVYALTLALMATIAERFPLHLTHKTNINITSAAFIAMILLLPAWMPGTLALVAVAVAQALRRAEPMEALFNVAQTGLYVTTGAFVFAGLAGQGLGPDLGGLGSVGAVALAATVMHVINTGLVAGAGAGQLGLNPVRVWASTITLDLTPHVTLMTLGTISAILAAREPLVLPLLALPAMLVHHAVRQTVQLRVDTHEALASLVEVIELRDPYTAGHSRRVAALSRAVALNLGSTEQEADVIEQAGRVHDIGKAGVDSTILAKDGHLTDAEWEQMKLHPVHGANVVARFAAYRNSAWIVRHHHEAWDGSGYPEGLAGEAIPFGARIISVVDTFDALTTTRPYRSAASVEDAIATLRAGAGTQWDPRVVDAFCAYVTERSGELPTFRPTPPRSRLDTGGRGVALPTRSD